MTPPQIETDRLKLVLQSLEDARAFIDAMTPEQQAELSADWLALFEAATEPNPWIHGFEMTRKTNGTVVGSCGFKGPPTAEGVVEIAYGVVEEHQGQGYATEAAQALTSFAFSHEEVRLVRAHTLPEPNASTRVLTKCGFQNVGEVIDPDDGPVWRWEKQKNV